MRNPQRDPQKNERYLELLGDNDPITRALRPLIAEKEKISESKSDTD